MFLEVWVSYYGHYSQVVQWGWHWQICSAAPGAALWATPSCERACTSGHLPLSAVLQCFCVALQKKSSESTALDAQSV
jgi:hypothetical protein